MATFFTSDTHFTHANIIQYCARPFKTVEEMDEEMVKKWNSVVKSGDYVYHAGDIFWKKKNAAELTQRLNGHKAMILGNHDWNAKTMASFGWEVLTSRRGGFHTLYFPSGNVINIAHRPRDLPTFDAARYKTNHIALCGHEHNNAPPFITWVRDQGDKARPIMAVNLSVEHWAYTPVRAEAIIGFHQAQVAARLSKTAK